MRPRKKYFTATGGQRGQRKIPRFFSEMGKQEFWQEKVLAVLDHGWKEC
ncbi:hypothetical protein AWRI1631_41970 [Saccharomyces cerevisiae AWRI1631]|uniref:Uncharacterized protein n=1 Tax=Saccharomyces cerevisiae (strain AWRI1631) TaxID=545124 RepID=B5VFM6_YEAS6|nr:hypothetical protein AWRI1631_41970 [Saccharomyces cerevisiae AWRI1631]